MSTLSPDQWQAVSPYLDQALSLTEEQRAPWLASLWEQDPALARHLQTLLEEHRALAQDGFLEQGPVAAPDELGRAGRQIGAYTLVSTIGQGGMGTVWLAERSDGRFERRAAVKFLSLGVTGRGGEERFKREGSILGRLAHPHIAQLLDAGVSQQGQPYLVLEHVEGEQIDEYCDQRMLDVEARVRLFLDVLGAVAHAHANLIVHRDLKPSNVLVRNDGQVKLLDFGIAKLLEDEGQAAASTLLTQQAGGALTPAYAAPEQVTGAPVTTATDVYALGVLLYVLLTGQHPAGPATRSPADLVKAIVDTEPAHASSVVTAAGAETELATGNAAKRASTPDKLRRLLRGDLDTILAKALKKNPQERYASVMAFADDLRRYLGHEPISARPDTVAYRAGKFLRRHWLPVAATALVVASLAGGLYEVNRERVISQRRFSDVRQLANKLFDIDVQVRELPGNTKTRQLIVNTAQEYLRRLNADARGDSDLALEVGSAYMQLARVQGVPIASNLGQMDEAEQNLRIAQGFIESVLKAQPGNRTAMLRAAQIAHDRMILARFRGQYDEAVSLAGKAAELLENFHAGKGDQAEASAILNTYLNAADQFGTEQHFEEALRLCARGTELAKTFNLPANAGSFLWVSAKVFRQRGDLDAARKAIHESTALLDPGPARITQGKQTQSFQLALIYEGRILGEDNSVSLGQSEEAVKSLERAFRIADEFVHRDPNDQSSRGRLAMAGMSLGDLLRHSDAPRALEIYDHTLRHLAEIKGNMNLERYEVRLLSGSTYPLQSLGRPVEARRRLDTAFEHLKQLNFYPADKIYAASEAEDAVRALGDYEASNGDIPGALRVYEQLLDSIQPGKSGLQPDLDDAMHLSTIYGAAAALYRRAGRADREEALGVQRRDLWLEWDRKLPNNAFVRRQLGAANLP